MERALLKCSLAQLLRGGAAFKEKLRGGRDETRGGVVAEGVGFEPTVPKGYTRSPGVPDRPLWHPSAERASQNRELSKRPGF